MDREARTFTRSQVAAIRWRWFAAMYGDAPATTMREICEDLGVSDRTPNAYDLVHPNGPYDDCPGPRARIEYLEARAAGRVPDQYLIQTKDPE